MNSLDAAMSIDDVLHLDRTGLEIGLRIRQLASIFQSINVQDTIQIVLATSADDLMLVILAAQASGMISSVVLTELISARIVRIEQFPNLTAYSVDQRRDLRKLKAVRNLTEAQLHSQPI